MTRWTRRIGDASARRPGRTVAAWCALLALVAALAGSLGGTFLDDFTAPGSDSATASQLLATRFPEAAGGSAVVVFAARRPLRDLRAQAEQALSRVAGVEHVTAVGDLFDGGHLSADGRIGYADLTLDVPSSQFGAGGVAALTRAVTPARSDGLRVELGGEAVFLNAESKPTGAEAAGLVAALVVLVVAFGTVVTALLPIALALVAVATGLLGITVLAAALDVSTAAPTIAAMIGLGVGIDYALFVVSRYRENRAAGLDDAAALSAAMGSSGSAVLFAGGTVVLAMAALSLTGMGVLTSIGLASALVVLLAVGAALTLLPALLRLLGGRVDAGRVVGRNRHPAVESTSWWRLAHRVAARPWPCLAAASAVLLVLAVPALSMRTGFPDAGDDAPSTTHRQAYDLLAEGFGPGINGPLVVVADLAGHGLGTGDLARVAQQVAADPGIAEVSAPRLSAAGDTAVWTAVPTTSPGDPATGRALGRLRAALPDGVLLTGQTAMARDLDEQLADSLPLLLAAVLVASFVLLTVVFRSVVVALKAVLMNLLSIGAAYGVVVAVFQWGWLGGLLGLDRTYLIASPLPAIFFAVLFGLSTDYEVFLVSRVREAYEATGNSTEAVARGLAATGRVLTSAALIMTVVFASFVVNPSPFVQMIGLGLAVAIALDATVVRLVLVPATMALLGRANWWVPGWLDRVLARRPQVPHAAPPPAAVARS